MKAFHNDPAVKLKYLERVLAHQKADEIVKDKYWENGKGCAVGCTIHGSNQSDYAPELQIPEVIAHLEDRIFESLPNDLAKTWPYRFLEAIPTGADLSRVGPQFAIFLLTDETQCASRHPQCSVVAQAYQQELDGHVVDWSDVRRNASDAAYNYTAYTAVSYAASYATHASAHAAAYAAYAAYVATYTAQSEKLLELLRGAK